MAERNEKVFERVRQELGKNANLGSRELYDMVKRADGTLGDTLQQFHARYVLPLKRQKGGRAAAKGSPKGRKPRKPQQAVKATAPAPGKKKARSTGRTVSKAVSARDNARAVLLRFAQDFSVAETKSEIVKVMSRLDDYVDQLSRNGS